MYSPEFSLRFREFSPPVDDHIPHIREFTAPLLQEMLVIQLDQNRWSPNTSALQLTFGVRETRQIQMDIVIGIINTPHRTSLSRASNTRNAATVAQRYTQLCAAEDMCYEDMWSVERFYGYHGSQLAPCGIASLIGPLTGSVCCGTLPGTSTNSIPQGWIVRVGDTRLVVLVGYDDGSLELPWDRVRNFSRNFNLMYAWTSSATGRSQSIRNSAFDEYSFVLRTYCAEYEECVGMEDTAEQIIGRGVVRRLPTSESASAHNDRLDPNDIVAGSRDVPDRGRDAAQEELNYIIAQELNYYPDEISRRRMPPSHANGAAAGHPRPALNIEAPIFIPADPTDPLFDAESIIRRDSGGYEPPLYDNDWALSPTGPIFIPDDPTESLGSRYVARVQAARGHYNSSPDSPGLMEYLHLQWSEDNEWPIDGGMGVWSDNSYYDSDGAEVAADEIAEHRERERQRLREAAAREAAAAAADVWHEAAADAKEKAAEEAVDLEMLRYNHGEGSPEDMKRVNEELMERLRELLNSERVMQNIPVCCVCFDNATHAFLPCGHVCICERCLEKAKNRYAFSNRSVPYAFENCPMCKTRTNGSPLRIDMSG